MRLLPRPLFGRYHLTCSIVGVLCLSVFAGKHSFAQSASDVLTNAKIVELVRAGFGDQVLIQKIRQSRILFDASKDALLNLKASGVSDEVILEMMNRARLNGFVGDGPVEDYTILPYGTEVLVVTREKLTSKKLKVGQKLKLEIAADLVVNGKITIAKGTPVSASVIESRKSGMLGRSGRLAVYIESTTLVTGDTIKLRAGVGGKDGDNMRSMFVLTVALGAPGLLMKGTNGQIPANTIISARIDETRYIRLR